MKKDIKAKWVKALRSGQYKQAKEVLHRGGKNGGFCCLGVLTDLYLKEKGIKDGWKGNSRQECQVKLSKNDNYKHETMLPSEVVKWAGLNNINPILNIPNKENNKTDLSYFNDDTRLGFKGIAKLINKYL